MSALAPDKETIERLHSLDVSHLRGLSDVDSHEMVPADLWEEVFGPAGRPMAELAFRMQQKRAENALVASPDITDSTPITLESVWAQKGVTAPSAIDLTRRPAVLDLMGISRQLVFPTFGLIGMIFTYDSEAHKYYELNFGEYDARTVGRAATRAHNDWAIRMANNPALRDVRIVGFLPTDDFDEMMTEAERLVGAGLRALQISVSTPPGGLSPADPQLDPLWAMLAERQVAVLIHIGTEYPFMSTRAWDKNVPAFKRSEISTLEFPLQPYWGATVNLPTDNFLTATVLGGVFERHPELRMGFIEIGAQWIGPLAERLDLWAGEFARRLSNLSLKPSEYINRNVRAAPIIFEDVPMYFDRYEGLHNSYCFSTDYPHMEGGYYAKQSYYERLEPLGDEVMQKFFIDNGTWLLPD